MLTKNARCSIKIFDGTNQIARAVKLMRFFTINFLFLRIFVKINCNGGSNDRLYVKCTIRITKVKLFNFFHCICQHFLGNWLIAILLKARIKRVACRIN